MKKIGIITYHRAMNYGAVLQAFALEKFIKANFDLNVEIVDYRTSTIESKYQLPKIKNIHGLIRYPYYFANFIINILKYYKIKKFVNSQLTLSKQYTSLNFNDVKNDFDIIVVGSDQVWNTEINNYDRMYYLDFNFNMKTSYAASIGKSQLTSKQKDHIVRTLESFKYLSVREKSSKLLLEDILQRRDIHVNIDPVFLVDASIWRKMIRSKISNRYILVYQITHQDNLYNFAKKLSVETGLKLIYLPNSLKDISVFKSVYNLSPTQFIDYIYNAEYVITNSFHGTAFSIIFNKKFIVEMPKNNETQNRIIDLLELFKLSNRILDSSTEIFDIVNQNSECSKIDSIIKNEQLTTLNYFKEILFQVDKL